MRSRDTIYGIATNPRSTTAARLLRQARRGRSLSQRQLAKRTRDGQPAIATVESGAHDPGVDRLDRLVGAAGHRLVVIPTRSQTAADAADAVHRWLRLDQRQAYRQLIQLNDDLRSEHGAIRVALTVTPPAPVGDRRYDAFIAAVVEHYLYEEGLVLPSWTSEPGRSLGTPWVVDEFSDEDIADTTPKAFLRRGILIHPSELASV